MVDDDDAESSAPEDDALDIPVSSPASSASSPLRPLRHVRPPRMYPTTVSKPATKIFASRSRPSRPGLSSLCFRSTLAATSSHLMRVC